MDGSDNVNPWSSLSYGLSCSAQLEEPVLLLIYHDQKKVDIGFHKLLKDGSSTRVPAHTAYFTS